MATMRVYEVAKHLGVPTKDLIVTLRGLGMEVNNSFSVVDADQVYTIIAEAAPNKKKIDIKVPAPPAPAEPVKQPEEKPMAEEPVAAAPDQAPPAPAPGPPRPRQPIQVARPQQTIPRQHPPVAAAGYRPPASGPARSPIAPPTAPRREPQRRPQPAPYPPSGRTPAPSAPSGDITSAPPILPSGPPPPQQHRGRPSQPSRRGDAQPPRHKKLQAPPQEDIRKAAMDAVAPPKEDENYTSPSKRYDAIKQKSQAQEKPRKGQKITFLKKRGGKRDKDAAEQAPVEPPVKRTVKITGPLTVKELFHETGVKSSEIIMFLMKEFNLMTTLNHSLDLDLIKFVCDHFGVGIEIKTEVGQDIPIADEADTALESRPPVVTIMGHVDHGKTKLLDAIRHTDVVATESGGITQHIGAYQITHQGRKITFLDTPGHESFTALRARGAKVTDLAVMVVAADDGVKPQTLEAIDHAREAGVPILIAINKIDKPGANVERVKRQLADKGLNPEEWGGDTVMVEISAKFNQNINELLDMMYLVTDLQELKANPNRKAVGTVIEAQLDKGKGPAATVLIQNGTLYAGDYVVVGLTMGRIRSMETEKGEHIPFAGPSMPVKLFGLDQVPEAGDQLFGLEDERTAREIVTKRRLKSREERMRYEGRVSLEDLFKRIQEGQLKEFKVIIKGDVQGSIEAITQALEKIEHAQVRVKVIRSDVGEVSETDVMLAQASSAVIMTFHTGINPTAHAMAQRERVEVRHYDIIYRLIDEVKLAMAGMLAPEYEEVYTGRAEVRQIFASSKAGNIAGCYVEDGEILSTGIAEVLRDGKQVYKGKIHSLKRFKDNVKNAQQGFECGIVLDNFNDAKEGDKIQCYRLVEKKREVI